MSFVVIEEPIKLKKVCTDNIDPPSKKSDYAAGYDLSSAEELMLLSGQYAKVRTGYAIAIRDGFEGQIRPRSGNALLYGLTVLNAPGTIDSDFRGEVCVLLVNHGKDPIKIQKNMRIAQLVIAPVVSVKFELVDELPSTTRGDGGFGSTGA